MQNFFQGYRIHLNQFLNSKVGWTSNNHGGCFVCISLVRYGQHQNETIAKRSILKYVCYGTREGRTNHGDCKHPCNARRGCQYPKDNVNGSYSKLL